MKNILSIQVRQDGCVETNFSLAGGMTIMEVHRKGLHDSKVLTAIQERKYYQNLKGEWALTFKDDNKLIEKPTFDEMIDAAHEFIFFRDNHVDYSGFC